MIEILDNISSPIAVWGNVDSPHGGFLPGPAILPSAPMGFTTKTPQNIFSASGNVKIGCKHKNLAVHRQYDVRLQDIQLSPPNSL